MMECMTSRGATLGAGPGGCDVSFVWEYSVNKSTDRDQQGTQQAPVYFRKRNKKTVSQHWKKQAILYITKHMILNGCYWLQHGEEKNK